MVAALPSSVYNFLASLSMLLVALQIGTTIELNHKRLLIYDFRSRRDSTDITTRGIGLHVS
jgi:hypothetical protein